MNQLIPPLVGAKKTGVAAVLDAKAEELNQKSIVIVACPKIVYIIATVCYS